MRKIKKGDTVVVNAGKDKGRQGVVVRVLDRRKKGIIDLHVVVEGINMIKKHVKANPNANQQGGIIQKEAPINLSNVSIFNPSTKKADRVGFKMLDDGKKVRVFKSNGEVIDV